MSKHLDRSREYQNAIREILLREWDPIGISYIPQAQDEYDSYIPHIYSQIIHNESEQALYDNLRDIEVVRMGLYGDPEQTHKALKSLMKLRESIEKNC
jgi:hypothetical protein